MEELGINLNYCPTKRDRDYIFECCERTCFSTSRARNDYILARKWYKKANEENKFSLNKTLDNVTSLLKIAADNLTDNNQQASWMVKYYLHVRQSIVNAIISANAQAIAWLNKLTQDEEESVKKHQNYIFAAITIAFAKEEAKLCQIYAKDQNYTTINIRNANDAAEKAIAFVCAGEMLHLILRREMLGDNFRDACSNIYEYWDKKLIKTQNDWEAAIRRMESEAAIRRMEDAFIYINDINLRNHNTHWATTTALVRAKGIVSIATYKSLNLVEQLFRWFAVQQQGTRWKRMLNEYSEECAAISNANDRSAYVLGRLRSIFSRAMKMNRECMRITKENEEESEKHRHIREKCRQDKAHKEIDLEERIRRAAPQTQRLPKTKANQCRTIEQDLIHTAWDSKDERAARTAAFVAKQNKEHEEAVARKTQEKVDRLKKLAANASAAAEAATHCVPCAPTIASIIEHRNACISNE